MITSTDNRIDELISRVKATPCMDSLVFLPAFPPHKTPYPVRKYTVAAELREVEDEVSFIGGMIDRTERGRLVKASLRLRVYAPQGTSEAALLRVSSMVAHAVETADRDGLLRALSLSGIEYDTAAHSEFRDITARLLLIVREEEPCE